MSIKKGVIIELEVFDTILANMDPTARWLIQRNHILKVIDLQVDGKEAVKNADSNENKKRNPGN